MGKYTDETIRIFIDESLEHLSDIENELLTIEQCGADIDENLVNKVYRAAHSIKGGAGFMGLVNIKNLTHEMENVLGKIRSREMIPDASIINVLLLAADTLRNLLNDLDNSDKADITKHMDALKSIIDSHSNQVECVHKEPSPITTVVKISFPGEKSIFSIPDEDFRNIRKEGKYLYLIRLVEIKKETLLSIIDDMKRCGVILHSQHADRASDDFSFTALFATVLKPADFSQLLDSKTANIYIVTDDHTVKPAASEPAEEISDIKKTDPPSDLKQDAVEKSTPLNIPMTVSAPIEKDSPDRIKDVAEEPDRIHTNVQICEAGITIEKPAEWVKSQTSLRVNIKLLDSLMTLAGELVLSRNQLLQAILRKDRRALEISGQRIDLITTELQEAIMHTRMQPIRNIFDKFPRVVRDLAISLNKKIDLFVEGNDVELDKSIIESLNDPMTHLIRNAADHGIEPPEIRSRQGKNPVGTIRIKAYHEAGQVNIEVKDDGKGMDGNRIAEIAISKGLANEEMVKGLSLKEKVNLIFLPGFSMSEKVTDISGRGVGMDVVKTNLDKLGGIVDIDSEPGKGTTMHIKLPLTLAIIPSLLISDGNERYAIPQVNVVELLRILPSQIKKRIECLGNAQVVRLRDKLLPLLRLTDILRLDSTRPDAKEQNNCKLSLTNKQSGINIVVVSTGIFTYGLIVDTLHDSEEIVVKPLGRHLKNCRGYAGATILGDGRVALILDIADIACMAELASLSDSVRASESGTIPSEEQQTLLLFKNSENSRFAIPLELVERIEKIRCKDIEIVGGKRVIQYRNSIMPLFDVGDVARLDKFEEKKYALVIVFFIAGMDVGLLAIPPIDTLKTACRIDETALMQPGIAGSTIIDGKTTLIVDIIGIIETLHPEWFAIESQLSRHNMKGKTVLLAEDSKFFRNQMKCIIKDGGYNVIDAEDGMIAWDLLQKNADQISLVVTDLEMPNLDGFDFTQKIKDDKHFSHLPVIAVSSLAGKEDIKKAKNSGVDQYQIKLDRKKLIECIHDYLG